ncbi:acyltransferase [Asticcacaulis sp. BYS171W]|uniref:Acyltransferase n=1 Tax=Asticcacaulis aquaticus TaxID=2984212 RepID=A0ABT5HPY0_9CAUL|nr:acyltransferase [Asticcacaulis aquaticus]MDC7681875.1 acyltransferase [Asticcacaulis aquaticus]
MKQFQRFAFLDGMRGVAAIAVMWYHNAAIYGLFASEHIMLAVDFFFCLSGFVIAHAYGERFRDGLTPLRFGLKRVIRLYPLILVGVALGAVVTWLGSATNDGWFLQQHYSTTDISIGALLCLCLLPAGLFMGKMFYFINSPLWSLFFEGAANAVYALTKGRKLPPVTAISAIVLLFGGLAGLAAALGGITQFGLTTPTFFLSAFVRVAFSFLVGVLICQFALYRRAPALSDTTIGLALVAMLLMPLFQRNWVYDMLSVALIIPALVMLGTRARVGQLGHRVWGYLGRLSYPLYVLHMPVIKGVQHVWSIGLGEAPPMPVAFATGLVLSWIGADLALRLFDEPVRAYLTQVRKRVVASWQKAPA